MRNELTVAAGEHHVLRVFALDVTRDEAMVLRDGAGRGAALGALLGLPRLDPADVQILDIADLGDIALSALLIEGHGAVEAQIAADRARLDALDGGVMIVASGAFGNEAATLHPAPGVRQIGTYREDAPAVKFESLPDAGAKGLITPPTGSAPASQGRGAVFWIAIGALVLLILLAVVRLLAG